MDENVTPELMVLRDKIASLKRQNDSLQAEISRSRLTQASQPECMRKQLAQLQLVNDQLNGELSQAVNRAAFEAQRCANMHATIFQLEKELGEVKQEMVMASIPEATPPSVDSPRTVQAKLELLALSTNFQVGAEWVMTGNGGAEMICQISCRIDEANILDFAIGLCRNVHILAITNFRSFLSPLWQAAEAIAFSEDAGNRKNALRLLNMLVKLRIPQDSETLRSTLQRIAGMIKKFPGFARDLFELANCIVVNSTFISTPGLFKKIQNEQADLCLTAAHSLMSAVACEAMRFLYAVAMRVPDVLSFSCLRCGPQCLNIAQRIVVALINHLFSKSGKHEMFIADGIRILARISCVKSDKDRPRELITSHSTTSSNGECQFKPPAIFGHYACLLPCITEELIKDAPPHGPRRLEVNILVTFYKELTST